MGLNRFLKWYQQKIGAYDKQQWERTVEEKILRGLKHVPKRTGKLKTDLIDIDLVTGSTYPKAKPQNGNLSLILLGVCRALFLPCWWQWWQRHTSQYLLSLLVSTYFVQLAVMMLCFCGCFSDGWKVSIEGEDGHGITIAEILSPVIVMIVLSIVHTHIAATHSVTSHSSLSKSLGSVKKSSPNMKRPSNVSCKLYRTRRSTRSRRSASEEPELPSPRQKLEKRSHSLDGQVCMYHQSHRVTFQNPLDATAENNNDGTEETCGAASESQQTEWSNCRQDEYISSSSKSMYVIQEAERKLEEAVQPRALFEDTDAGISDAPVGQDDRRDSAMELNDSGVDSSWASAIEKRKSKNPNASHVEVRYSENGLSSGCEGEPLSEGEHGSEAKPLMNGFIGKSQSRFSGLKKTVRNGFESKRGSSRRRNLLRMDSSQQSSGDSEDQTSGQPSSLLQDSSPDVEWTAIDSYSSESPNMSDEDSTLETAEDPFNTSSLFHHTGIGTGTSHLVSNKVTVSCMIWEGGEVKKAGLSVLDISSAIISKVEHSADSMDYLFLGLSLSLTVSLLPLAYRAIALSGDSPVIEVLNQIQSLHTSVSNLPKSFVQSSYLELIIFLGGPLVRFVWAAQFFFLLAVAERTFKQRFLLSKLFCYLTSARRARQNDLPHFRLNKVRNIKTWLSVRSYLKKHGPQRSVDIIVSAAFILSLLLLSLLCCQLMKDEVISTEFHYVEAVFWCLAIGVFLLRFVTLGVKINHKYRNLSILITEQINLYLQMEQKPHKKDDLMLANNVLKLAAELIKELESPFKISGLSANPILYNVTKLLVLSAFSACLSRFLGFKLKLYKLKL